MSSITIAASTELASAPEEVWRFVSDTDRTNRALGAKPVQYEPIEDEAAGGTRSARFVATTTTGGVGLTYEEQPFEWTHAQALKVVRTMRGGLLASYSFAWALSASGQKPGGTHAEVKLELRPRSTVLAPLVWLQGRLSVGKMIAFAESIDAHVRARAPSPFEEPKHAVNEELLAAGVASLVEHGTDRALANALAALIRERPDADLLRLRPFELAAALGHDRERVLRAMLQGVAAGLFDLRWAIICPSCRTASELADSLDEVKPEGHCHLCDLSFELELDRAVEATFAPHEAVRRVENQMFCMGGPARTPHVWSQTNLEPGESRPLSVPREPGRYRVFARGGASASVEVAGEGAAIEERLRVTDGAIEPAQVRVAPGAALTVTNGTSRARHVKLERLGYASDAATAYVLSTMPEFRRLFSRDLLKPGTPLRVARATILFSDLTGSTALYAAVGDAAAFRLVDDHFDVLRRAIDRRGGVLVKTMGDATMVAFADPRACALAAAEMLSAFDRFREEREHGALVGLKLGAASGPCYIVTANASLDYFGQTVNVASRVQHLAGSGELVVSEELAAALGEVPDGLRVVERFEARVKGVEGPLGLVRLGVGV
jgi:class 3 adenylate cyclase